MKKEDWHEVVWPSAKRVADLREPAGRVDTLKGKTVAELWSWTFKGDVMFAAIEKRLSELYPGIKFISWREFGEIHGANERQVLEELPQKLKAFGADAAITGVGGGASGAAADVRCSMVMERLGIPTVTIVTDAFANQARAAARGLGCENLPIAVYPGQPLLFADEKVYETTERVLCDDLIRGLTIQPECGSAPEEPGERDIIFSGSFEEVNEFFYRNSWQDGLPIIPPTIERVEHFLKFTDMDEREQLGIIQPDNRKVTVWNVAVNGVMSGCRPQYMPVLIAIIKAMLDPKFQHEHLGHSPGMEELIIVNGGIIDELEFNCTQGVFRPGYTANTSIGRFWRLFLRNMARLLPHEADKSCFGDGYRMVLAENEKFLESIGWDAMSVDAGFENGDNLITICSCTEKTQAIQVGGGNAEETLRNIEKRMGDNNLFAEYFFRGMRTKPVIIIPPAVIRVLASEGYTKEKIKRHFHENTTVRLSQLGSAAIKRFYQGIDEGNWPEFIGRSKELDRDVRISASPDDFRIVVSGDEMGSHVLICAQQGIIGWPVTKKIELPVKWNELMKECAGDEREKKV